MLIIDQMRLESREWVECRKTVLHRAIIHRRRRWQRRWRRLTSKSRAAPIWSRRWPIPVSCWPAFRRNSSRKSKCGSVWRVVFPWLRLLCLRRFRRNLTPAPAASASTLTPNASMTVPNGRIEKVSSSSS